ncbi:argininosuccinate lyase [Desulfoplanes formicivorans]|uniref:Argininosuccinate lyase n=1 Tax=Desulfoplanes formicivorans TaxID=1592317 RepID=A0A194AH52_9BACT|nr:argininosuccinate lyase [Desulfoplanes formicivorans]GAU09412.1 argininosuccinate lyase [Desulfoplanes formicivorans]
MASSKNKQEKLWGGRFKQSTAPLVEEYTVSETYDRRLYAQDIAGSKAHARMLARQGVLTRDEAQILVDGLDQVAREIQEGTFVWRADLEDVHMNIENRLTEIVGSVGQKLHTGRSRNDQVALDFRLCVVESLQTWERALKGLVESLLEQARNHQETLLPGYTHMQPAQPVSLAHHLLAYCQMFCRDVQRVQDCARRASVSPLGAAALAGTTYPLDPDSVAQELGLQGVFANSMDAVSDRDFVLESLFVGSQIMAHLSRLCEEIIIWSNPGFGFIRLPDAFATGSSIMPQKKNPDVAELMRGKTGRVYGNLMGMLTTMKGLPLAYNRDMQEDKEPFFDTDTTVTMSVTIMGQMVEALMFNPEAMHAALRKGFLNATELADYLVGKGIPFRQAHHITGNAVAYAEKNNKCLEDCSLEELQTFSPLVDQDVFEVLAYDAAVKRREVPGGTGPRSVAAQIRAVQEWLDRSKEV